MRLTLETEDTYRKNTYLTEDGRLFVCKNFIEDKLGRAPKVIDFLVIKGTRFITDHCGMSLIVHDSKTNRTHLYIYPAIRTIVRKYHTFNIRVRVIKE